MLRSLLSAVFLPTAVSRQILAIIRRLSLAILCRAGKKDIDYDDFCRKYVENAVPEKRDFYPGYFSHLMSDYLYSHNVVIPMKRRLDIKSMSADAELYKHIKANWAELEYMWIKRFGRPWSLEILFNVGNFPNSYFEFGDDLIFERRARSIANIYENLRHITDDTRFLGFDELESYINDASQRIIDYLSVNEVK